jgi:hypothetical protein
VAPEFLPSRRRADREPYPVGDLVQRLTSAPSFVSAAAFVVLVTVVAALTVAQATGVIGIGTVAATPQRIASGRLWLLITSGLLVQKPFALSLLSFAVLGALTLVVCGWRVLAWAALLGHVTATLIVYGALNLVWLASPDAFAGVLSARDYGVSAIAAAWLGAVAYVAWRRRGPTLAGKAPVVISCAAIAAFAWMLHRHLNVLDSEHGFAFVIGAMVAGRHVEATLSPLGTLLRQRRARHVVVAVAGILVALAVASFADALGSRADPHARRPKSSRSHISSASRLTTTTSGPRRRTP